MELNFYDAWAAAEEMSEQGKVKQENMEKPNIDVKQENMEEANMEQKK